MPNTSKTQKDALFWVFLGIFAVLLVISLLIITNVVPVDADVKGKASYLLFGSLAVAVVALFYDVFMPKPKVEIELVIGIIFDGTTDPVRLDVDNCHYAIYDQQNQGGEKKRLHLNKKGESWECIVRLGSVDESVRLYLKDTNGKNWSTANIGMKLLRAEAM